MSDRKTTPKAGLTLLSRDDDKLKFFHSPSGAADFALKHKLNKVLSLGLGFTDNTVRKIKSLPGLVASADLKARSDTTLSVSHNIASKATKLGVAYDALRLAGKKSALRLNYVTPGNAKGKGGVFTGELGTALAPNKKTVVGFNEKGVSNVKLLLTDEAWTYEPSYNLLKKAPSLAVSRPVGSGGKGGRVKMGWNLKTDDLTGEWQYDAFRLVAVKRPDVAVPTIGVALERAFAV